MASIGNRLTIIPWNWHNKMYNTLTKSILSCVLNKLDYKNRNFSNTRSNILNVLIRCLLNYKDCMIYSCFYQQIMIWRFNGCHLCFFGKFELVIILVDLHNVNILNIWSLSINGKTRIQNYPSIFCSCLSTQSQSHSLPIPVVKGQKSGYTQDRLPAYRGTNTKTVNHSHSLWTDKFT